MKPLCEVAGVFRSPCESTQMKQASGLRRSAPATKPGSSLHSPSSANGSPSAAATGVGGARERVGQGRDADARRGGRPHRLEHRVGPLLHPGREVLRRPGDDDRRDGHSEVQRKLRSETATITTVKAASTPSFGSVQAKEWSRTATPRRPSAR